MRHARKAHPIAPSRPRYGRHVGLANVRGANDNPAPRWKRIMAGVLDGLTALQLALVCVDKLMAGLDLTTLTAAGWTLTVLVGFIAGYFVLPMSLFGTTLWRRCLGIGRG